MEERSYKLVVQHASAKCGKTIVGDMAKFD
jgi:hypothetical protein